MTEQACFPFIVGRGRSGTTLIRSMLASHPEMAIPYESHFPVTMALAGRRYEQEDTIDTARFLTDLLGHWAFKRWDLPPEEVVAMFRSEAPEDLPDAIRLVYRTYAKHHGKSRFGEKTPSFVLHIPLLAHVFPESRFIHIVRDGRDVALSYRQGGWGPKDVEEAAIYWKRFVERGRRDGLKLGPERYLEIRYEDLIDDPENHVHTICRFIDLDFDDQMLRYFENGDVVPEGLRPHLARGHQNLKKPPTKGMRDWRREMSRKDAAVFEALAGDLLAKLGYERVAEDRSIGVRLKAGKAKLVVQARRAHRRVHKLRGIAGRRHIETK